MKNEKISFIRQKILLGKETQTKIENNVVGIIGVGGLGSAIAHYLVRLGVKKLILIDHDKINNHNLNRQHMYTFEDINKFKVEVIKEKLLKINPEIKIKISKEKITKEEDFKIFSEATIIFDGLDNHTTRKKLDSYCKKNNKIWIHGAAIKDEGSVYLFDEKTKYENIYSKNAIDQQCETEGVIVTTTSIIAGLQVQMYINYLMNKTSKNKFIKIKLFELEFGVYNKK